MHVLKGATQKVLGAKWTASTYAKDNHGRLVVQFDRKPTQEELQRIEKEANRKVGEGTEILEFEMERQEAENHFGDQIYDLFPIPASVTRLRLVRIPDWNVNCCAEKHLETTAAIGRVKLERTRFRNSRKELELEFRVSD
jgi:alanyl-tRNA synthetase